MGQLHSCLVGKGWGGGGCLLGYYLQVDIDTHIWVISPSHSKNMLVLVKIAILQNQVIYEISGQFLTYLRN